MYFENKCLNCLALLSFLILCWFICDEYLYLTIPLDVNF